jgi:hypothetical protein
MTDAWLYGGWVRSWAILKKEEEEGQLLDVVAVGEAVVAEDVSVGPELLGDLGGGVGHGHADWGRRFSFIQGTRPPS